MRVFPDTAASDIGLVPVLERLGQHLGSERVIRAAAALPYASEPEVYRHRLQLASELQDCLRFDDPVPFRSADDPGPALDRARPEGAALNPDDFLRIRDMAATGRVCKSFFATRADRYRGRS